jgi:formylglycine-generating enzyme required for sulfatase activity
MGSPKTEKERGDDEQQVDVTLTHGFWLGKYEVTHDEWKMVMGVDHPSILPLKKPRRVTGPDLGVRPVESVTWRAAMKFCDTLTSQERRSGRLPLKWAYSLPTEAQWEYACRAGTTSATAFGDQLSSDQANFDGRSPYNGGKVGIRHRRSVRVGSYKPNAWGLCDMHGNASEWCRDFYIDELPGGKDPYVGLVKGARRVCRDGGWSGTGSSCRSAARGDGDPEMVIGTIGFRVVLAPE